MADKEYIQTSIPPGGRRGQSLVKASGRDYNVKWATSGGGESGEGYLSVDDAMDITDIIDAMNGIVNN